MKCNVDEEPFPDSWMVYLTFGQPDDFFLALIIPTLFSLLSTQYFGDAMSALSRTGYTSNARFLAGAIVFLTLIFLVAVARVARRTYSPSFHQPMHIGIAALGYLFVSVMLVTLATLANWVLVASSVSWPTSSEIGAKLCVSLLAGLVLISLQYRSAISGTYSNRTTVEDSISTILEVAADVRQSPDVIRDTDRISEFTTAVHQIIAELEDAPLSDEQQLQVCLKEWIAEFEDAIPDRQEKFITGEERSEDELTYSLEQSNKQFRWICRSLKRISNDP